MLTILRDKFWRSVRKDENNLKKKKKKMKKCKNIVDFQRDHDRTWNLSDCYELSL